MYKNHIKLNSTMQNILYKLILTIYRMTVYSIYVYIYIMVQYVYYTLFLAFIFNYFYLILNSFDCSFNLNLIVPSLFTFINI